MWSKILLQLMLLHNTIHEFIAVNKMSWMQHIWILGTHRISFLACQFANMAFQNPFAKWYELLLNTWHPLQADENSSLETSEQESVIITKNYAEACTTPRFEQSKLLRLRRQSTDDSLNTIRSQSSMDQNRIIFENLTMLKNNLMELKDNDNLTRSSHVSQNSSLQKSDRKMNPHDKGRQDDTMNLKPWSPLLPVEQNITIDRKYNWPIVSKNRSKRQIRTIQKKKAHKNSWLE